MDIELSNGAKWVPDLDKIFEADVIAYDVEHSPEIRPFDPEFSLWGCTFSSERGTYYCTDQDEILRAMRTYAKDKTKTMVAHNAKYEALCLAAIGLEDENQPARLLCTMLGMNVLYDYRQPNRLGLKLLIDELYDYQMMSFEEAIEDGEETPKFYKYATDDGVWTLQLGLDMMVKLEDEGQLKYAIELLGQASIAFADIERFGIKWDDNQARKLHGMFTEVAELAMGRMEGHVGSTFNPGSYQQVNKVLFRSGRINPNKYKIPFSKAVKKKLDNGEAVPEEKQWRATDSKTLMKIAHVDPLCGDIMVYRTAMKQLDAYLTKYTDFAYDDDFGRYHPRFSLNSQTGRTRAADSFQAITARYKKAVADAFSDEMSIRSCFIAEDGWSFVGADLSQIELRIIGKLTKEPAIYDAYLTWNCAVCGGTGQHETILHECPDCGAEEEEPKPSKGREGKFWHGRDLHQEQADLIPEVQGNRDRGKVLNFSLCYNVGTGRLVSEDPSLSYREWDAARDQYLRSKPKLTQWHTGIEMEARSRKCLKDLLGRKRRFRKADFHDDIWWHTKNQAINFKPQASASGIMLLSIVKMRKHWIKTGDWGVNVRIVHMVHDEVILEVRNGHEERVAKDLQYYLERSVDIGVPIRAEASIGRSWKDIKLSLIHI